MPKRKADVRIGYRAAEEALRLSDYSVAHAAVLLGGLMILGLTPGHSRLFLLLSVVLLPIQIPNLFTLHSAALQTEMGFPSSYHKHTHDLGYDS